MAKKEIRSKYIRSLVEDAASTSEKIQDATKDAVESLLESTINKTLRKLISEETEDDSEKEESTPDLTQENNGQEENTDIEVTSTEDNSTEDNSTDEIPTDEIPTEDTTDDKDTVEVDTVETSTVDDDDEGEESDWTDFEQFKDEDGEYDLTGQDDETVYKVLMAMDPEKDGIRLVKNEDGKFTLTDDNTEKEYIIDLECGDNEEPMSAEVTTIDEELGYTDNYQNQTAMTTPDNSEPSKFGRTWDKGVPTGTEKPWVGDGAKEKGHPYDDKVNECGDNCSMEECGTLYEIEIDEPEDADLEMDEAARTQAGHNSHRGITTTMKREGSATSATDNTTTEYRNDKKLQEKYDNLNRKASAILAENKELKGFATKINEKLRQTAVMNASLAKVIKLMTENSTTKEEKNNIISRFSTVNTTDECNRLYETISEELKNRGTSAGSKIASDKPLTESKNSTAKETKMLDSSEATDVLDFMKRLAKVK